MKCNQCNMAQISTGGISLPCHEHGCPNSKKVWDEEEQEWVTPEPETEDDLWEPEEDDDEEDWDYEDEDRGGTSHGDISYSDADPGL